MSGFGAEQLEHALTGLQFPARSWQVIAWADYNGAAGELRAALRALPDRIFGNLAEIATALRG